MEEKKILLMCHGEKSPITDDAVLVKFGVPITVETARHITTVDIDKNVSPTLVADISAPMSNKDLKFLGVASFDLITVEYPPLSVVLFADPNYKLSKISNSEYRVNSYNSTGDPESSKAVKRINYNFFNNAFRLLALEGTLALATYSLKKTEHHEFGKFIQQMYLGIHFKKQSGLLLFKKVGNVNSRI